MHAAIGGMRADIACRHVAMPATFITGHDDAPLLSQGDGWCCDQQRRDCERLEKISHFPAPSVIPAYLPQALHRSGRVQRTFMVKLTSRANPPGKRTNSSTV